MPICESQEAPFSRLLDTKTWAPQKGCDGDEDAGGVYVKVLKSSRWSAPTRGSQGKNPGDVPLKCQERKKGSRWRNQRRKQSGRKEGNPRKKGQEVDMVRGIPCCTKDTDGESPEDVAMWKSLLTYGSVVFLRKQGKN